MELKVKHINNVENCFISLPVSLIQTLESSSPDLPQPLTLQLRSTDPVPNTWVLAWSGASSFSQAIEVAQQFAECISLPDNITVRVRVVSNVPKATLVTVEPHTEDDWEVLELNSEYAEGAILSQVRILHEAMRFPLWLHGHTVITFSVISTFPKKGVDTDNRLRLDPGTSLTFLACLVQLVQDSEVAVAPKRREKNVGSYNMQSSNENHMVKAQLRIQNPDKRFSCSSSLRGVELGIGLTTVAFIHPQTARNYALESSELVILMPKFLPKDKRKNLEGNSRTAKSNSVPNNVSKGVMADNSRHVIVCVLLSESVARGHVMIAEPLCQYLRAGVHSWVYIKECNTTSEKNIHSVIISPCHFIFPSEDVALEKNTVEALDDQRSIETKYITTKINSYSYMDITDLLIHYSATSVSDETSCKQIKEVAYQSDNRKGLRPLLQAWCLAQLDAIASNAGKDINSLVLGSETLLYFEVKDLGYKFGICEKAQALSDDSLESQKARRQSPHEVLCLLKISEESQHGCKINAYDITFDDKIRRNKNWQGFKLFQELDLGDPVTYYTTKAWSVDKGFGLNISSLSWMGTAVSDVVKRMMVLLSPTSVTWFSTNSLPLPGHVLIYGPPGSGKTLLARAVARSFEEHEDLLAHIVLVCCSKLALEKGPAIRQALCAYISEALDNAPSVMIFDDLDSIISSSSDSEVSQPSTSVIALTEFLTDIVDEYGVKRKSSCGIGPIAFIATLQDLDKMPEPLRSSGRFDYHVQLPAPAAAERQAILRHEIEKRSLKCSDEILLDISSKCDGYDAYDLEILVDRTVHASIGRFLSSSSSCKGHEKPTLVKDDFSLAMQEFVPVAMRDITKSAPEGGSSGWNDVGGLGDIRDSIKEMIELPSKFSNIFAQAPLRLRSNVLLYGPPGCGKTHIVGAAAAACSLRFISIKGPELLNKYIGASEQAVRDIFSKAAAAAPCLLFFDEFDSIAPKRGHDNTGVTDRVVNQFLTELDGVEVLTGVFVFAATSRPDLLDAALLRPGRLDRLLFCDFPSRTERLDILKVLSGKLPLADDVDLDALAYMTEGFSGADLQALFSDAQLAAVHELLDVEHDGKSKRKPVITNSLLNSIALKARPSVSDAEKTRLYEIYSHFFNAKRSVSAQSREAKGKRATLA